MSYIVFARKWRPKNFDELLGQDHIAKTLKNAISSDRIAHAYIFTGPRGIGKTSTARILAKALNCKDGPTPNPCNKCQSCRDIQEGTSLDVLEIDGASNRGIDEVRNLRDNIKFSPIAERFKIYIIDEVHMLTNEAFNALLKTLEEPPQHVKFIFATTHPHKVIPTIMSRCQRFDFRRISINLLIEKLKEIADSEKIKIDKEAALAIAKAADGSLRDAESMLDQLSAFCKGGIKLEDVVTVLGIVQQECLLEFADYIIKKDTPALLKAIERLINNGKDITVFINNLIEHFRNLIVLKVSNELSSLVDLPKDAVEILTEQCQKFSFEEILYIYYVLVNTLDIIKKTNMSRIPLEVALIKLTKASNIISLSDALKDISKLEKSTTLGNIASSRDADILPQNIPSDIPVPKINTAKTQDLSQNQEKVLLSNSLAVSIEDVKKIWPQFINIIKAKKMSAASYLAEGSPVGVKENTVIIGFSKKYVFHKEALERSQNKDLIESNLRLLLKADVDIKLNIEDNVTALVSISDPMDSDGPKDGGLNVEQESDADAEGVQDPDLDGLEDADEKKSIVKSAINMFGAKPAGAKSSIGNGL